MIALAFLPSFGVDAACPLPFTFFWVVLLGFHLLVVFSALHCVVLRSSFPLWVCCFPVLSLVGWCLPPPPWCGVVPLLCNLKLNQFRQCD